MNDTKTVVSENVTLPNGYTIKIINRIDVSISDRELHGPSVCRAPNGDLILCHQDSQQHEGGDGYVHQWRSTDDGFAWKDEGVAAKWSDKGMDSLFGEYSVTPDGSRMVMLVQRRKIVSGDPGIVGSVWYISDDNGRTWDLQGEMDPGREYGVMYGRSPFSHDGVIYVGVWSREEGSALYVSADNGESWQRRSVIFPSTYPDFKDLPNAGPFYTNVMFLPNGTLIGICYNLPPKNICYIRTSLDCGKTWGSIAKCPDLPVWAPRLNRIGDDVLVVTGRDSKDPKGRCTVAFFSVDNGITWGNRLVIDRPSIKKAGSMGYSDSIQISENRFWVFTSSEANILGVLLQKQKVPKLK